MPRYCLAPILLALLALVGCTAEQPRVGGSISVAEAVNSDDNADFARAVEPRTFVFPRDHGPHPEYQTEWWYYTGNLTAADGRHFGYQLTFFRRSLRPFPVARASAWATHQLYMAHFALTDTMGGRFYAFERFSRDGAGLAGAEGEPFRVFLEDWSASGDGPDRMPMRLQAVQDGVAIDLRLASRKPPVLQGDRGLSQKGPTEGNASYYYSLTRMATDGTVRVGGESYAVTGLSWMDREWSTSALEVGMVGWDWFSLQLDDGYEVMFYQLRRSDGGVSPFTAGSLAAPDGETRPLTSDDVRLDALDVWRSPRSDAVYPSRWRLHIPAADLMLEIEPRLADQELPFAVTYWEGAVRIAGTRNGRPVRGDGYVEMTGYAEQMARQD